MKPLQISSKNTKTKPDNGSNYVQRTSAIRNTDTKNSTNSFKEINSNYSTNPINSLDKYEEIITEKSIYEPTINSNANIIDSNIRPTGSLDIKKNGEYNVVNYAEVKVKVPTSGGADIYEGEYVVTPSQSTIILNTADFLLEENVTINPIPNNYGLITWNGNTLTVS